MTKRELDQLLPEVLPAVRAWVASANDRRSGGEHANK
jgi:hypothetical protein